MVIQVREPNSFKMHTEMVITVGFKSIGPNALSRLVNTSRNLEKE